MRCHGREYRPFDRCCCNRRCRTLRFLTLQPRRRVWVVPSDHQRCPDDERGANDYEPLADLCHIRAIVCVPDYELGGHQVRVFPRYYKREREASEVGVRLARRTSRAAERGEVGTNGRRCRLQGVGCRVDAVASAGTVVCQCRC